MISEAIQKTKNSAYVFTCTAGHLDSSFVPAVGHLPVCFQKIFMRRSQPGGGGGNLLLKFSIYKYWYLSHFYMAVFLYFRGYNIEQVSVWKVLCVTSIMSSELFKSCACYKIQLAWW